MQIKYDKEIDAKYVRIKKGKISHTKKEQDWLLFDCDQNGEVLGIEILDASKHLVSFSTFAGKFLGYSNVQMNHESDKEGLGLTIESPKYKEENQFNFA